MRDGLKGNILDGLILLRDFGAKRISKRRSEDLRKEFARLAHLRWHTITRYDAGGEVEATKGILAAHGVKAGTRGTKRKSNANDGPSTKSSRKRLRSYCIGREHCRLPALLSVCNRRHGYR